MRYFRLKNARKWKICHTPKPIREAIVNQAKFFTRRFVDTGTVMSTRYRSSKEGTRTHCS